MDNKFARHGAAGTFIGDCCEFFAHQIRKDLPNRAEGNGAAAAADQRPIKVDMVTGMFERRQAKRPFPSAESPVSTRAFFCRSTSIRRK